MDPGLDSCFIVTTATCISLPDGSADPGTASQRTTTGMPRRKMEETHLGLAA